jgi:hypothetical protein
VILPAVCRHSSLDCNSASAELSRSDIAHDTPPDQVTVLFSRKQISTLRPLPGNLSAQFASVFVKGECSNGGIYIPLRSVLVVLGGHVRLVGHPEYNNPSPHALLGQTADKTTADVASLA